ncbi:MAG: LacI family DNA-binding transcriptional regulator [Hyphomicrobiaceae bacterium]
MSSSNGKARIIDIALQAGVSTATVDRVLNERPGASRKMKARVHEAMQWLDRSTVRPVVVPSVTADISIDVLIADKAGFANDVLTQELRRVAAQCGVNLKMTYPRRLDPFALADALHKCSKKKSRGIIVQSLDHPAVREAVKELCDAGVTVVSILTSLPGAQTLGYVGLDNRAAGRTAGLLMGRCCHGPGKIAVFWGGALYRCHEEREFGFRTVLRGEFPQLELLTVNQGQDDPTVNYQMAKALLESHADLCGIYNVGAGNRGIEKALIESGRKDDVCYIAFNLTPLTKQALLTGVMDAVIHQDMGKAAQTAVEAIIHNATSRPVTFPAIPIEIIMRENVR